MSNLLEDFEDITEFSQIKKRPTNMEEANKLIDALANTIHGMLLAIRVQEHGKKGKE